MSEQERKATLEKIQKYIDRTKMDRGNRCALVYQEAVALYHEAYEDRENLFNIISMVFDYGMAKNQRAMAKKMKEGKK